ncbi:contactin-associated protein-like 2 isoform X2 [Ptychodera flava]|uniref:contactin-associated protein-like 2 isoform X2 n=1 Tax=Ptychodera flava TaxID=63121 RepID=UPI003969D344
MAVVRYLLLVAIVSLAVNGQTDEEDDQTCDSPLGMEAGSITDDKITASSVFSVQRSPYFARLNRNEGGGGWTAATQNTDQYLSIDLGAQTEITAVATQGRSGSSEWVTQYSLEYSSDGELWNDYTERGSRKVFDGNTDARTSKKNILDAPIIARHIRFRPKALNRQLSMRVEVYGCLHNADTVTFDGTNYAIYDVSSRAQHLASTRDEIRLRMKTNRPDGVVMAGSGTQTDYIVLELKEGDLILNLNLGSSAKVSGSTQLSAGSLLDDNHWHNIRIVRDKRDISMTVDRHTVHGTAEGDFERLDLDKMITFGGAVDFDEPGITVKKNFIGCLENVFYNNDNIIKSITEGVPAFRTHGKLDYTCQDEVVVPITFPTSESYIRMLGRTSNNFTVLFEFRAYDQNGLLVYNELQDKGWIIVTLKDGRLRVDIITTTAAQVEMEAGDGLNDGQWHSIRVEVSNNFAQLKIDGREWNTDRLINIQTTSQNYIGGAPNDVTNEGGFRGCMKNLYMGPQKVDFLELGQSGITGAVVSGVNIDTCGIVDRCNPDPCEHDGICRQNWDDFACDCSNTGYGGSTCHTSNYERSCEVYKLIGRNTGNYYIDPDLSGPLPPFMVTCNMDGDIQDLAQTEVSHDTEQETEVNNFGPPGSYKRDIDYNGASVDQIAAMIEYSEECTQFISYRCRNSKLLNALSGEEPYGWWVGRTNEKMVYWGGAGPGTRKCDCGIKLDCTPKDFWCNCDRDDNIEAVDSGDLIDKEYLPVVQLRFGDTLGANSIGYHELGKLKCKGDVTLDNVATFRTEQAHIRFPTFDGVVSGDASFDFKTTAESGVLLYNRGQVDYIRVELLSPNVVQFSYNVGNGRVELKSESNTPLNDNDWHTVKISRNMKEASLQVDTSSPTVIAAQKGHYKLNLSGHLYVGTTDLSTDGYVGCMRALMVNGKVMDLAGKAYYTYGVSAGCTGRCDSDPCFNDGICIEEYSGYKCNCTATAFGGPICSTEVGTNLASGSRIRYTFRVVESIDSSREEVRVGFVTNVKQGTLVRIQSGDFDDYLDISLNNQGNIVVSFNLGDGDRELIDPQNYADGLYHDLTVVRDGPQVVIRVDTYGIVTETFSGLTQTQLNSPRTLFIGRYDDNSPGFVGCISRVSFNDIYPLKKAFEEPRPNNIVLENAEESMCGVEPSTLPPTTREPFPPSSAWPSMNVSFMPVPASGAQKSFNNDGVAIGCVVAVLIFAIIVLLVVIGRYIARHKGSYNTNEAKGAESAPDADTAVRQQPQVEKKKEWYI